MATLFSAAGLDRIERADSMEEAVVSAARLAAQRATDSGTTGSGPSGRIATVLLSPAAASFDMFVDYAARGRAFKQAVASIAATYAGSVGSTGKGSA